MIEKKSYIFMQEAREQARVSLEMLMAREDLSPEGRGAGDEQSNGTGDSVRDTIFSPCLSPLSSTFSLSSSFLRFGESHPESGSTKNACAVPVWLCFWRFNSHVFFYLSLRCRLYFICMQDLGNLDRSKEERTVNSSRRHSSDENHWIAANLSKAEINKFKVSSIL